MNGRLTIARGRLTRLDHGQISTNQFVWLLVSVITSYAIAFVPSMLMRITKPDGWISIIISWACDLALALVYAFMGLRFPRQSMVQYATSALGPWLGKPVGAMFPLFFWFACALLLRWISELLVALFLPGTPSVIIIATMMYVVAYGARAGLETMARAAETAAPLFVLVIATILTLVTPKLRFEYLAPALEDGWMPTLSGVPLTLSFFAICILMGMFQPYQDDPKRAWFAKFTALSTGSLIIIGLILASMSLIGPEPAASSLYPDLAIVQVVAIGEFFERIEVLWMAIAVGAAVLSLSILLWASAVGLAQTFGLREYQPLVFPLAAWLVPISLVIFDGQVDEIIFTRSAFPLYALSVEAGLEVLIWIVALVRGIRGEPTQEPARRL